MAWRAAAAPLVVALALGAAVPAPAGATAATAQELQQLAQRAQSDPAALAELRRVDSVDGRRYPIAEALEGAEGDELQRRLEAIAGAGGAPGEPARRGPEARGDAEEILSDNRYEGSDLPRPFKGLLEEIGDALRPIWDRIRNTFEDIAGATPGGSATLWTITAALLLALLATLGSRTLRDRAEAGAEARAAAGRPERETPAQLERDADRAEREGDLERALRLRFRAGLLRLDAREAISFRPSISPREVSHALRPPEFDQLAALFDGVVYGGREPTAEDVKASRRGWETVLKEVPK